jgi:hypothetical protein
MLSNLDYIALFIIHPKLSDSSETLPSFRRSRVRSEAFQRYPRGEPNNLDTGLPRYEVKRFFQMKSLILVLKSEILIS